MDQIGKLFRGDKAIWAIFFLLCAFSLVEIYSSSSTLTFKDVSAHSVPMLRHGAMLLGGIGVVILLQLIPFDKIPILAAAGLLGSILLLLFSHFGGAVTLNDTNRWVSIMGIQLQPSEFAKVSVVMMTAFILSKSQTDDGISPKGLYLILGITGIILSMIITENLSTAMLLAGVVLSMMLIGNVKIKTLGAIVGVAVVGLLLFVMFAPVKRAETWRSRISSIGGESVVTGSSAKFEITDKNFQVSHAKIAVSRGGFFGTGPGKSVQRDVLPQAYSDFVFSIVIEEYGIIGALLLMLLYLALIFRVMRVVKECDSLYGQLLALGCGLIIIYQALINMVVGVNLFGIVTGQPLPLISRGGTSTVVTCAYIGIILSISTYNKRAYPKLIDQSYENEGA